jgi:uncharacterized membrane protein
MASTEISIIVERPLEEVFAYVVAIENLHEWTPVILESWPVSGNPPEVGSTYIVKAEVMGKTMEIPSEVTGYEANRLYAYKSYGSLAYEDTITFQETEAGTLVTEHIDMKSPGRFSRLLDALKLMISKRSHQKNQQLLKTILESGKVVVLA